MPLESLPMFTTEEFAKLRLRDQRVVEIAEITIDDELTIGYVIGIIDSDLLAVTDKVMRYNHILIPIGKTAYLGISSITGYRLLNETDLAVSYLTALKK